MNNDETMSLYCLLMILLAAHKCSSWDFFKENFQNLKSFAEKATLSKQIFIGFPVNQLNNTFLDEYNKWANMVGLDNVACNNCGDPFLFDSKYALNTHAFERDVVKYFAAQFYFKDHDYWGIVTNSGTDGNNHGIYFGRKQLSASSANYKPPLLYVNKEAHHSITRIADLQNIEIRQINATSMGEMDLNDFRDKLDVTRPSLVVVCIGTTFKGAIDNLDEIVAVLKKRCSDNDKNYYIHLDAALFGGFLPFVTAEPLSESETTEKSQMKSVAIINQTSSNFDSISVSGHKFFGLKEPMGVFVSTSNARHALKDPAIFVSYLRAHLPTLSCSRSASAPLKFWWLLSKTSKLEYQRMTKTMMVNARYLHLELLSKGIKAWRNKNSNIVFFERSINFLCSEKLNEIYKHYAIVINDDSTPIDGVSRLAHIVVMPHVSRKVIDQFLNDLV